MSQPDLLSWVAAPATSGPRSAASDGARTKATSRQRWDAWAKARPDLAAWILDRAREQVRNSATRVSAKRLAEDVRATFHVDFNNSATAGLGEWLSEHEDLRPFVERRGKATP